MNTIISRKQTAFRLSTTLLEKLQELARKENRSLNNYVESVLIDVAYNEPNDVTRAAIEEARSGKYGGTVNTDSMESFLKSCGE